MNAIVGRRVIAGPAGRLRTSKFKNQFTEYDGRTFPSKKEAHRYQQLRLLEKNGEVRNIRLQVVYRLTVHDVLVCKYRADFVYEELRHGEWREVVEDVKGYRTPLYRLKKKLMLACFGIDVMET